jgi:hypothetical protein
MTAVRILATTVVVGLGIACSSSTPSAPTPIVLPPATAVPPSPTTVAAFTGTWTGMGTDSQGATRVTWTLTQSGDSVAGTVKTQAVDPADGSCGSCHRNKSGTFTGTISPGGVMRMMMFFAAGVDGDPTPACTATLGGSASTPTTDQLSGIYVGSDSCEGNFENGTLTMARQR